MYLIKNLTYFRKPTFGNTTSFSTSSKLKIISQSQLICRFENTSFYRQTDGPHLSKQPLFSETADIGRWWRSFCFERVQSDERFFGCFFLPTRIGNKSGENCLRSALPSGRNNPRVKALFIHSSANPSRKNEEKGASTYDIHNIRIYIPTSSVPLSKVLLIQIWGNSPLTFNKDVI